MINWVYPNVYCIQFFLHFPMFYLLLWGVKTLCDLSLLSGPRWGEVLETETTSSSAKMFRSALEMLFNSWSPCSPESIILNFPPKDKKVEKKRAEERRRLWWSSFNFSSFHLLSPPSFFSLAPTSKSTNSQCFYFVLAVILLC